MVRSFVVYGIGFNFRYRSVQAEPETDEVYAQITLVPELDVSLSFNSFLSAGFKNSIFCDNSLSLNSQVLTKDALVKVIGIYSLHSLKKFSFAILGVPFVVPLKNLSIISQILDKNNLVDPHFNV